MCSHRPGRNRRHQPRHGRAVDRREEAHRPAVGVHGDLARAHAGSTSRCACDSIHPHPSTGHRYSHRMRGMRSRSGAPGGGSGGRTHAGLRIEPGGGQSGQRTMRLRSLTHGPPLGARVARRSGSRPGGSGTRSRARGSARAPRAARRRPRPRGGPRRRRGSGGSGSASRCPREPTTLRAERGQEGAGYRPPPGGSARSARRRRHDELLARPPLAARPRPRAGARVPSRSPGHAHRCRSWNLRPNEGARVGRRGRGVVAITPSAPAPPPARWPSSRPRGRAPAPSRRPGA